MPLHRRLPKRGFKNIFRKEWNTVPVEALERVFAAGATVDAEALGKAGSSVARAREVKVLGTGDLNKALTVVAHQFTEGARKKIEAAGGRCEEVSGVIILESFRNIFAVPDLRKRVLFTFGLLAIYRIGSHIPTPGLDAQALEEFFKASAGGLLGFLDMFSGGALRRLSVFALGIMPYITASIILQLLTVVWPYLEKLSKEGEMGRRKITQYTRYGTVVLSVVQGAGIALWLWGHDDARPGKFLVLRDPTSEGGKSRSS